MTELEATIVAQSAACNDTVDQELPDDTESRGIQTEVYMMPRWSQTFIPTCSKKIQTDPKVDAKGLYFSPVWNENVNLNRR